MPLSRATARPPVAVAPAPASPCRPCRRAAATAPPLAAGEQDPVTVTQRRRAGRDHAIAFLQSDEHFGGVSRFGAHLHDAERRRLSCSG